MSVGLRNVWIFHIWHCFICMSTAKLGKMRPKFTLMRDYSMGSARPESIAQFHCPVLLVLILRGLKVAYHLKGTFIRNGMANRKYATTLLRSHALYRKPLQTPYWRNGILNKCRKSTMFSTLFHSEIYPIEFATFFCTRQRLVWLPKLAWTRNIHIRVS